MYNWKIVPICDFQRLDVRKEDLLDDGDFRKCDTYRGGGGYDQFPKIAEKRLGVLVHHQFVVQLYGCNLDCPYCYLTRSGVWGDPKSYSTTKLVDAFVRSKQEIFHLMGGAPAIYLEQWPELIRQLPEHTVFHSDFLLTEKPYDPKVLWDITHEGKCKRLFAVDIKGVTPEDYERNTRKPFKAKLFFENLEMLVRCQVPFYITFTNPDMKHYEDFTQMLRFTFGGSIMEDAFVIPLIDYDATPYVDVRPKLIQIQSASIV